MCFAPQRRALFRHLNLQKWSVHGVFCAFSLRNVLRATTTCTFSTSQLPKVVRTPEVFCTFWLRNVLLATTACTFSTSQLPKVVRTLSVFCTFWLGNVLRATTACNFSIISSVQKLAPRPVCFVASLTWKCALAPQRLTIFRPLIGASKSLEKHSRFSEPTFLPFRSHKSLEKHSLLSSYSFSSTFLSSNLPLLSASSLLCFFVGSLTSKLPSIIPSAIQITNSKISKHVWRVARGALDHS